jgi:hypothetical protein
MVAVKTARPRTALLPAMRTAVASVDPALPIYDAMTLDDRISDAVARPRFNAALLAAFAGAALLLAAIGVYGVLSYSVSSRKTGDRCPPRARRRRVARRRARGWSGSPACGRRCRDRPRGVGGGRTADARAHP